MSREHHPGERRPARAARSVLLVSLWAVTFVVLFTWVGGRLIHRPPRGGGGAETVLAATAGPPGPDSRLAAGELLVATHELRDPNFRETVILLVRYGAGGAVGLVLNRPAGMSAGHVLGPDRAGALAEVPLYVGGPVRVGELFLLVGGQGAPEELEEVLPGVRVSQDANLLEAIDEGRVEVERLRVFGGYAGWGPGQLEGELDLGSWRILPGDAGVVFDPSPVHLWRRLQPRSEGLRVRLTGRKL